MAAQQASSSGQIEAHQKLDFLFVNVREGLPNSYGRRPREFLMVFPPPPLDASVQSIMQMIAHEIESNAKMATLPESDAHSQEIMMFEGSAMFVVDQIHGSFHDDLFHIDGEAPAPEPSTASYDKSAVTPGIESVQFKTSSFMPLGGLYNLIEGCIFDAMDHLNARGKGLEHQNIAQMKGIRYALLEAQVLMPERFWESFNATERPAGTQLKAKVVEIGESSSSGVMSNPVDFVVIAIANGVEEGPIRDACKSALLQIEDQLKKANEESMQNEEGDEQMKMRMKHVLEKMKRQLLAQHHPDKHAGDKKHEIIAQALNAIFDHMLKKFRGKILMRV